MQEQVRQQLGPQQTAFHSVLDGKQTLRTGEVLRLATKPVLVGRALYFTVGQVNVSYLFLLPCNLGMQWMQVTSSDLAH